MTNKEHLSSKQHSPREGLSPRDEQSLSAANPLATADQRALEDTALRVLARPELKRTREAVAMLWRQTVAYPARDQMSRFENMIDEYMFNYTVRAVNSDANHPKAFRHMAPAHHWFGRDVPGSRWGGDSPDFIYRLIPIGHGGRYEIRCIPGGGKPAGLSFQLLATRAAPVSMGVLESVGMTRGAVGARQSLLHVLHHPLGGRPAAEPGQGAGVVPRFRRHADAVGDEGKFGAGRR